MGRFFFAGVELRAGADGVHGSSMLHDDRRGHDTAHVRTSVIDWLRKAIG